MSGETLNAGDQRPFANAPPISECGESERLRIRRMIPTDLATDGELWEMLARDRFPLPSLQDREGYAPTEWRYWGSGLLDFLKVRAQTQAVGWTPRRVLDFGCASGRVLRHFLVQGNLEEVWGSDLNFRHIRWLRKFLPGCLTLFNRAQPSLDLPDNHLDLITAFSVFTHLDETELGWLRELRRLLRPGGIAYLTIHNEATWEALRELKQQGTSDKSRLFQSLGQADRQFLEEVEEPFTWERRVYPFGDEGPYRVQVFHQNQYIERVWGQTLQVLKIIPRYHVHQSVVLLRK